MIIDNSHVKIILCISVLFLINASVHGQKSSSLKSRYSFQAGIEVNQNVFFANKFVVGDTMPVSSGNPIAEIRGGFVFLVNYTMIKNLTVETGFHTYEIHYEYRVGGTHKGSGMFVNKASFTRAMGAILPLNIRLTLLKLFYVKGGVSLSLLHVQKDADQNFVDVPYVNKTFNGMKDTFKPVLLNYGLGVGINVWRLDLGLYITTSQTKVNRPFEVNGKEYAYLYDRVFTSHLSLTYRFKIGSNKHQQQLPD